jgi:hypothetical protein
MYFSGAASVEAAAFVVIVEGLNKLICPYKENLE